MGWMRTLLLGDIGNHLDIEDTGRDVARVRQELSRAYQKGHSRDQKIEMLIRENAELKLYLASLIRLLVSKGTISQTELEALVEALDAEDGASDGKYRGPIL